MKKKYGIALLIAGVVLICLSVLLAIIATANKDIIGGADLPTFFYVFFSEHRGLYSFLAVFGVLFVAASAILSRIKEKR